MLGRQVVVLGDANVDLVIRLPDRSSGGADLTGSVPQLYGGGSAANVAVALARLGVPAAFVGAVGDDGYGRWVRDDLIREGVDTRGLRSIPDAFTPMVIAMIETHGERLNVVWPPERGADNHLCPDDVDPARIAGAAWMHTTGMCLRASPVREAVLHAMQIAHEAGVPVSLDLNLRLELWGWRDQIRKTIDRAIALADVVLGSAAEEIAPVAGVTAVESAAHTLCADQRIVVARLGAGGALAATPDGLFRAPAFPARVVDTLGAGDAFDGGFVAARAAGGGVLEALRWGNAVAALKIERSGARGLPSRDEVERLLHRPQLGAASR
ncbi:MAG TPA: carbohydrate kinase family protein [Aggregatilineaceae bacterium]|nr:carbohydrate kinase family protein [Aggregatilineaceae bacterium]